MSISIKDCYNVGLNLQDNKEDFYDMKKVSIYFQIHQPFRLKKYRFFNIGKDHFYFDDYLNRIIIERIAADCYRPMNDLILRAVKEHGLKITFSITGTAIEQLQRYAPDVIDSFRALADTGNVEFLSETYSHSLASLKDEVEFARQVEKHAKLMEDLFGARPRAFRNTELIYNDVIGEAVEKLGFETILTEGSKQVLGWKSPNYIYSNPIKQRVKLLLRNYKLSDDITFRYEHLRPTAADFVEQLAGQEGDCVNLFMDYETFGEHVKASTGIFDFMGEMFAKLQLHNGLTSATVSETAAECQSVALLNVPHPISWADEERDLTAWLGNELQDEAISKLYALADEVAAKGDPDLDHVWSALQASDHFYYMCTKWFADGDVHKYFNPYDSPYEAFMNYMNVISDFQREVK